MDIIDGAKIFIKNDQLGKYLFVLRDNNPNIPMPGHWDLVGGGIESGESPLDTIKREIKEEINIEIYDVKQFGQKKNIRFFNKKIYRTTGTYFIGKTKIDNADNIQLKEGQKIAFFTLDEILKQPKVAPSVQYLIRKYSKILN